MLALVNACVIATYTYVDGIGARLSGNAVSYTLWMSLLPPVLLFAWAISRRGVLAVVIHVRVNWWRGLIGGSGSIASYGLALWAMTQGARRNRCRAARNLDPLCPHHFRSGAEGKGEPLALPRRRRSSRSADWS